MISKQTILPEDINISFNNLTINSMASNADEPPRDGQRIMNSSQFIDEVSRASHVAEKRSSGYYHHYLVEEVEDEGVHVIHYGPVHNIFARVHQKFLPFDKMDFGQGVYLICSDGYPQSEILKDEAIRRACSRIGEDRYKLAINNCEHFVTWALTGKPFSHQIKDAKPLKKFGIDFIDACYSKSTAVKPVEEGVVLGTKTVLERGTVPKQLENQVLVIPKTPTSPAKTCFDLPATELATMPKTMPTENFGRIDPRNIINSSKELFSHMPDKLKLDERLHSAIAIVQKALAETGKKIADDKLPNLVVDKAWAFMPKTMDMTRNMAPKLGKKFVDDSLKKWVSDTARKYMIDLNAVQTGVEAAEKAVVEKAGKEAVKKAGAKSIQAVDIIAGKSAAAVEKVAVEKAGEKSIQAAGKIAVETAGQSAAAVGTEAIKQAAKHAAKTTAISTTVFEMMRAGYEIFRLYKDHDKKTPVINDKNFQRGVCTTIFGAIGSIAGSTAGAAAGAALGQILIPLPGVGALLGSMFFGLIGKAVFSGVSGFLFDRIMK